MSKTELTHQNVNTLYNVFTVFTYKSFTTPIHFHKNIEFIYALEGNATVTLGSQSYTLNQGECIIVFPYRIHSFTVDSDSTLWVATFAQDYIKAFYKPMVGKRAVDPVFELSKETRDFLKYKLIDPLGKSAFFASISKKMELTLKSCLYAVGSEFMEKTEIISENHEAEAIAVNVLQYISENFRDDISLRSAAEALGYNYQYISRIFNQSISLNFKTVLNQYRFEYALQLLQETDKSITDIAFESGFQSLRTFNRVSYEMFNTSPMQCRKKIPDEERKGDNTNITKGRRISKSSKASKA